MNDESAAELKIDEMLVERVAKLSRLTLSDDEKKTFLEDFKSVLDAFKVMQEADVGDVESSFKPIEQFDILRKDAVLKSISQDDALRFTKNKSEGYFVGPKTIDN